ncbi:MAG: MCE family protein [Thermoanaerobaculaceae bacterium]|nr:MCE family protein [Thermoanaerobaculaceae bacterium]
MFEQDPRRKLRVGLFTAGLLVLLGFSILLLGKKQQLFVRQVRFLGRFNYVGGLVPGAPVWLNGVVVGSVEDVILPADPAEREITVVFRVAARVARRLRTDSRLRIRTLGLLGDRYLELTSGSPSQPRLEPGAVVESEEPTDLAAVIAQGGDAMTNVQAITSSLRKVLDRIERGEGMLGQLTVDPESGRRAVRSLYALIEESEGLVKDLRAGKGAVGRLVADPTLQASLVDDIAGMARSGRRIADLLVRDLERNDSLLAGILRDPQGRERLQRTLEDLAAAGTAVAGVAGELTHGRGTLGRLVGDEAFAQEFLADLHALAANLRSISEKLDGGQGSVGKAINDPQLYEDLENVVRGIRQSRTLGWLIRNRRAAGEAAGAAAAKEAGP